jgi:serine/threonine protein kinase
MLHWSFKSHRKNDTGLLEGMSKSDFVINDVVVGKGASGVVFKASLKNNPNELFALKIVENRSRVENEIRVYTHLLSKGEQHPNVLKFYGWFTIPEDGRTVVVLEFVQGSTFMDHIKLTHWTTASTQENLKYFVQISNAVLHCHSLGVIHRDIKPQNVLIDATKKRAMLMDFDLSIIGDRGTAICGTPNYMAPEVYTASKTKPYDYKIDFWSLGVMLYVISTKNRKPPFESYNLEATKSNITSYYVRVGEVLSGCISIFKRIFVEHTKRVDTQGFKEIVDEIEAMSNDRSLIKMEMYQ